jgi:hypothetical protein
MDPPAARCKGALRPGMPRDKSKNGAVEFFGICFCQRPHAAVDVFPWVQLLAIRPEVAHLVGNPIPRLVIRCCCYRFG